MDANYVICRNEVIVEGESVGVFESFETRSDSRTLGNSAVLTLPLYALGAEGGTGGRARARMREVFVVDADGRRKNMIRPCAQVEVWCWYDGWDAASGGYVSQERVKKFQGFIEHVDEGFPTRVHLQDNSFILRFGAIQKGWDGDATLQQIVEDVIPVAQQGFEEERSRLGFTRSIPSLTYSVDKQNVQAVTTSLAFRNWGARSPFDTIQKLMQLLVLYGGVSDDYNVFVGAGVETNTRPLIELATNTNVVERDLVPVDGRFVDYDVKIVGILKNGRRYTATGGYGTSRSGTQRSEMEQDHGESFRGFSTHDTVEGIQKFADDMLAMLKGLRNSGTIKLTLYPDIHIMDWVTYTDTVFEELSSGYYVIGYTFKADQNGYFQTLQVTDKVFNL